ncbi:alpha/beta hydrolase family protein [Flavobacterium sp.]|uniref:alpha/beta hydrolase family protein n=1 Tax=Flavobacterium sp. TaxID=239 RepID=UPI002FDA4312
MKYFVLILGILVSCQSDENPQSSNTAVREVRNITYNGVTVDLVIEKPNQTAADVLLVYHGTVMFDNQILQAAHNTLTNFKNTLNRKDMMIISVAYPEENLLFGDNILHAEAALLWVKNRASQELGITVNKIFMAGHSQGGYLVTRLNTMHSTHGVIANAPGPLNLNYRCSLEENGQIASGITCSQLQSQYGNTIQNPDAYFQRSLLNFTQAFQSDILFIQGLNDSPIQMYSWPVFKQQVNQCTNCQERLFVEIEGQGHGALFSSTTGKQAFNNFINSR